MTHGGDVGAEGAGAKIGQAGDRRLTGERAYAGDERRLDLLAVGLADRPEAHDGRDGGCDLGQNEGLKARLERQPVTRSGRGDRRRIGDALRERKLTQRLAIPGGASGEDKGAALSRRLEATFGGIGERDGERVRLRERFPVFRYARAKAFREQDGVGARGAEGQEIDQPAAERAGVVDVAALHRPFQPL